MLATGARGRVIPIPGLRDGLPRGAHVLRSLDDARDISAAALNVDRAVVIGGGPLGLELACGLRHRGVSVTVMSIKSTLLDRDLDPAVAQVAEATASDLGIDFVGDAQIASVSVADGRVTAVRLADGTSYPAGLVVLAAGTAPETGLAGAAGLETNIGIVVGHDLRTTRIPHLRDRRLRRDAVRRERSGRPRLGPGAGTGPQHRARVRAWSCRPSPGRRCGSRPSA